MGEDLLIALVVACVAALYGSVGHGGASGYLAVMALLAYPPSVMKPGALALNLLVAGIGAVQYFRAGHFRIEKLWPFAVASIPLSYVGARMKLSPALFGAALGAALLWAGARMILQSRAGEVRPLRPLPAWPGTLLIGAAIGLVSGMVGVGGGIFLSPLFILMGWADAKETAAVSAAFIWLNSAAGLLGQLHTGVQWPDALPLWVLAAAIGGAAGSHFGARRWSCAALRHALGAILFIASFKSILSDSGGKS